jgi:aminoglycoside phosphotransferase (APT) family kinase protein
MSADAVRVQLGGLLDVDAVRQWLESRLPVPSGLLEFRRVSTGHSNEMFEVRAGDDRWILRRPPRVTADPRASNMSREYRVLSALDQTAVPHPSPIALCEDPDVTGVPFLVMEWIDGFPGRLDVPPPFDTDVEARRQLAFSLIDTLAALAAVDWRAIGLEGFGRPEGFLERQVARWLSQLERYRTRPIPHLDEVAQWLEHNIPRATEPGILHGDYGPGNVLFASDRPGRVRAVVDWEQATVGDPLLDLGWLTTMWEGADEDPSRHSPRFSWLGGLPRRRELIERYREQSLRPLDSVRYYQVLARFKLACVLEGSYFRYATGVSDDPFHASFEARVPEIIGRARAVIHDDWE